jgi:hypothetical protein
MGKKILLTQGFCLFCLISTGYSQPATKADVAAVGGKNRLCAGTPSAWDQCVGTLDSGGNIYTGEFRKGKIEGKGKLRIIVKGRSTRDAIASEIPSTYVGEFKGNRIHGYGVWTTDQGQKFEGYFVDNIYQGKTPLSQQSAAQARGVQQNSADKVISKATISSYGKINNYYLYSSPCEIPHLKKDYPYKAEQHEDTSPSKEAACYAVDMTDQYIFLTRDKGGVTLPFASFDLIPQPLARSRYVEQLPQQAPQRPARSAQQQQICNNLAQKIRENDPSQNGWLAIMNGLQAANAQAGNYGNGGVAMTNQNKIQQEQLFMQLNDQYMRHCQ